MKMKNNLIILFAFVIIFSFLLSFSPINAKTDNYIAQSGKIQQNSCPIYVKNGQVTIPIDINPVYGVYNYTEYDVNLAYNAQTAPNHYDGHSYSNGVISNISLAEGTQVVVTGYNTNPNATDPYAPISDFCGPQQQPCNGSGLFVFNGAVNASIFIQSVNGVYNHTEYDFGKSPDNQTVQNYFTVNSTYDQNSGTIKGINLVDGTRIVVTGKDQQGNTLFIDQLCQGPPPQNNYGVSVGDWMSYILTTDSPNNVPFFGLDGGQPVAHNGSKVIITVKDIQNSMVLMNSQIDQNPVVTTNESIFFIVPINELEAIISGKFTPGPDPNGPIPTYLNSTTDQVFIKLESPQLNATIQLDRYHGTLMFLDGTMGDPMNPNNIMKIQLSLHEFQFANQNGGGNQAPVWGVQEGDSFKLQFTSNMTSAMPFFGLDNNNFKVTSGDIIQIDIVKILIGLNKPGQSGTSSGSGIEIKITDGDQSVITQETMFLVMPTNMLDQLASLSPTDPNYPPDLHVLSSNDTAIVFEMKDPQGQGQAKITMDRVHGTLMAFEGVFKDPQGNFIEMRLTLAGASFGTNDSNASKSTITTDLPGFDIFVAIPLLGLAIIFRKRNFNGKP